MVGGRGMDEKLAGLLSQYEPEITRANRVKGAWILETGQGLKLFGSSPLGESKLAFEQKVKQYAREHGFPMVDCYVPTKEGNYLVTGPYGEGFVLRDWFAGEECDAQKEEHVLLAAETLAGLHKSLT